MNRLTAERRLKKSKDFHRLKNAQKKIHSYHFLIAMEPYSKGPRLGITVSTKIDKRAVVRNRIKRLIREVFRKNQRSFQGFDIVVIARKNASHLSYKEAEREIIGALRKKITDAATQKST